MGTNKRVLEKMEDILCMKCKPLFLGNKIKGIHFEVEDFQELLRLFEQIQNKEGENDG